MALIDCQECGKQISNKAAKCIHCGSPVDQGFRPGCGSFILLIMFLFFSAVLIKEAVNPSKPKTEAELRTQQIEEQFDYKGSHIGLERFIKKSMNNRDSYDHIKTTYRDAGDYLIVETIFRGKNAFGGTVKNSIMARVDFKGNVIKVISTSP